VLLRAFSPALQEPRWHGHRRTGCGLITIKKLPLKCSDWQYSQIATHKRKRLHSPAQSGAPGGDLFRDGASNIQLYRASGETQAYASFFDYGIFRCSQTQDGDTAFHQVFRSAGGTVAQSSFARTEFSVAPNGVNLRIYTGDAQRAREILPSRQCQRACVEPVQRCQQRGLDTTVQLGEWHGGLRLVQLLRRTVQLRHARLLAAGSPNIVYVGSAMQYSEIGGRSDGRAIQHSEGAGVHFTDMTIDTQVWGVI